MQNNTDQNFDTFLGANAEDFAVAYELATGILTESTDVEPEEDFAEGEVVW